METRANYVLVGAVSLALLALVALFIVWLAQLGAGNQKDYDIFFEQSVGGLAKGSAVTFQGVDAGQVQEMLQSVRQIVESRPDAQVLDWQEQIQ